MKNLVMVLVALVFVSGCALYGNEAQYEKGDWHGVTGSQEVAKIQRDKHALVKKKVVDQMALDKLMSQPVDAKIVNGAVQGYKGVIQNLSRERVNVIIEGPETQSFFLRPGEKVDAFLLPGSYYATTYLGNRLADKGWSFPVGVQKYTYQGKQVHWYVYYDP